MLTDSGPLTAGVDWGRPERPGRRRALRLSAEYMRVILDDAHVGHRHFDLRLDSIDLLDKAPSAELLVVVSEDELIHDAVGPFDSRGDQIEGKLGLQDEGRIDVTNGQRFFSRLAKTPCGLAAFLEGVADRLEKHLGDFGCCRTGRG